MGWVLGVLEDRHPILELSFIFWCIECWEFWKTGIPFWGLSRMFWWIECWEYWNTRLISLKGLVSEGWEFWKTEIGQFRDLVFWWIEWVCVESFLGEIGDFLNLFWRLGLLGFCFTCCWIVFEGCWCYYLISFCCWDCWALFLVGSVFCCCGYCTSSIRVSSHIFSS